MKLNQTLFCMVCVTLITACQPQTVGYMGPSVNAGPVTVSAHINSDGEIVLDGSYSHLLFGTEELGLNWDFGFETTLNKAKTRQGNIRCLFCIRIPVDRSSNKNTQSINRLKSISLTNNGLEKFIMMAAATSLWQLNIKWRAVTQIRAVLHTIDQAVILQAEILHVLALPNKGWK